MGVIENENGSMKRFGFVPGRILPETREGDDAFVPARPAGNVSVEEVDERGGSRFTLYGKLGVL